MGEGRTTDEPQANQRLTVAQAATVLNITEGAVRSRIKRGTLPTVKEGGTVYVMLGGGSPPTYHPPQTGGPTDEPSDQSPELVESLQEQLTYLRAQLEAERNAHAETRRIAYTLAQRIPELEPPRDERDAPETASEGEPGIEAPASDTGPPRASWWRRFFGFSQ